MTSKVEIWNLALGHIGSENAVESDTERSPEADQCRLYYDRCRDQVLRAHDWPFASTVRALSLSGTAPTGWSYSYSHPTDCLNAREIPQQSRNQAPPIPFRIHEDSGNKFILCDQADISLRYTKRIEDPNLFDEGYIECLALLIASRLAMPLTRKADLRDLLRQEYTAAISLYLAVAKNEGQKDKDDDCEIVRARS